MLYLHILLFCWNLRAFITVYGVILRQCYVSSVLTLYGRAACGGQRCRYSQPETENSLIIQHQHLTTILHSDIYVGFSTDDIQHNTVGKENRLVSLAFISFTGSVRKKQDHRDGFLCIISKEMDNNTPESGGYKGGIGSLFGGGTPEYSNTELAGVPCKLTW